MDPNDFHDKAHVWGRGVHPDREAKCWCEPFLRPDFWDWNGDGVLSPLSYHRPDYAWLFWEDGEQGPRTEQQTASMNEHEAKMLADNLGITG